MPSAKEVGQKGIELGEMNKILLKKIEGLTLILIERDKEFAKQSDKIKVQDNRISEIEKFIADRQ